MQERVEILRFTNKIIVLASESMVEGVQVELY